MIESIYVAGVFAASVYGAVTINSMNRKYEISAFDRFDCVFMGLVAIGSWASVFGTLLFRFTAGYGLWGGRND
jgi:hypothetical protein